MGQQPDLVRSAIGSSLDYSDGLDSGPEAGWAECNWPGHAQRQLGSDRVRSVMKKAEWGPVRHIRVIKERRSGISRGFAFVDFPSVGAAQTMMDRFVHEGHLVYDSKLFFEYSLRRSNILSTPLENIEEPLKFFLGVFDEWGPIRHIRVIKERRSGISHGFAFVDFPSVGAAQTMIDRFVHEGLLVYDSKLFFEYRVVDLEETNEASKETRSETHQAVALAIAAESI
ncbi:hypothetical protein OROMI_017863 [Orobanche minor]